MGFLSQLRLTDFRSYERADLSALRSGVVVLCGPNGAGKTNVLEAISILAPGRGLRRAKPIEIARQNGRGTWSAWARIDAGGVMNRIGTGLNGKAEKRIIRINGETARSQAALADYMACLWLTPQMDRLFLDGASERRRFLDRMIFSSDPAHAGRVSRYENVLRQRSRLLQEGKDDRAWLEALEAQMVETGVAIAASRLAFVAELREASQSFQVPAFPKANFEGGAPWLDFLRFLAIYMLLSCLICLLSLAAIFDGKRRRLNFILLIAAVAIGSVVASLILCSFGPFQNYLGDTIFNSIVYSGSMAIGLVTVLAAFYATGFRFRKT